MNGVININDTLYVAKRKFRQDGWFGRVVQNMNVDELLAAYHCDMLFKGTDEMYYLVNKISDVEILEETNN
jgi:hypothetical protein